MDAPAAPVTPAAPAAADVAIDQLGAAISTARHVAFILSVVVVAALIATLVLNRAADKSPAPADVKE